MGVPGLCLMVHWLAWWFPLLCCSVSAQTVVCRGPIPHPHPALRHCFSSNAPNMVDFFNIWDLITSVLSLGATFLVAYAYHQLPSKRMNALFSLLDKTDDHLKSCVEKGLLDAASAAEFGGQMTAWVALRISTFGGVDAESN